MVGVRIDEKPADRPLIRLVDILSCVAGGEHLRWSILYLDSSGVLSSTRWDSYLELERTVRDSPIGVRVTWEELHILDSELNQIIDLILVGSRQKKNLKKYSEDTTMFANCEQVIEMVDSSYWLIHSQKQNTLECLISKGFPETSWCV